MNEIEAVDIWWLVRDSVGDETEHKAKFYASDKVTQSTAADIALCAKDAKAGNKRAMKYMAKFMELRMRAEK